MNLDTGLTLDLNKTEAAMEAKLRYSEFHRQAAIEERMAAIKQLRLLEAQVARHNLGLTPGIVESKLGFKRLRMKLMENRRSNRKIKKPWRSTKKFL